MLCFIAIFLFLLSSSCASNIIQAPKLETLAGEDFKLRCDHPSLPKSDYIHWYRISPDQGPVYIIGGYSDTQSANQEFKLIFGEERKFSDLNIRDVKPEDSAAYLCAQSDQGTAQKLMFGSGTRLHVTPKTEREIPSVYKLQADKADGGLPSTVCLVTDFPTPNTTMTVDGQEITLTDKSALDKSSSDVWRYSAVVWDNDNPSKDLPCKVTYDGKAVPQEEKIIDETATTCSSLTINERFRTNPGMNTLSLSVLGLRMLTAKAIIFNLIITLRLWSS